MMLSEERYEFIKGEAVALLERYNVRRIPISGLNLARRMGIRLKPYSALTDMQRMAAEKVSGDGFYLEDNLGNEFIYYNDDVSRERLNMTLLHEIGHCVLDHRGESDEEEAEANFFAKYAAAPPPLVHRLRDKSPKSIENAFRISHAAAVYAGNYYRKWLAYGSREYTDYEIRLLRLFFAA